MNKGKIVQVMGCSHRGAEWQKTGHGSGPAYRK